MLPVCEVRRRGEIPDAEDLNLQKEACQVPALLIALVITFTLLLHPEDVEPPTEEIATISAPMIKASMTAYSDAVAASSSRIRLRSNDHFMSGLPSATTRGPVGFYASRPRSASTSNQ